MPKKEQLTLYAIKGNNMEYDDSGYSHTGPETDKLYRTREEAELAVAELVKAFMGENGADSDWNYDDLSVEEVRNLYDILELEIDDQFAPEPMKPIKAEKPASRKIIR